MEPAEILTHVRELIEEHADGDPDRWWYANRFVFARLMLDERQAKTAIKKQLRTEDPPCAFCGKPIGEKKAIHLHRLDHSKGYTHANCALAHGRCHLKHHRTSGRRTAISGQADAGGVLTRHSKRYDDSFLYGWDITPRLADALDQYEVIEFVEFICDDTEASCLVPVSTVKRFLTSQRLTTRGDGNWEVKVRRDREGELAFGPGKSKAAWLYLPVTWIQKTTDD